MDSRPDGYENRSLNVSSLTRGWGSRYNLFYGFDNTLPVSVTEFDDRKGILVVNVGFMYYYNPNRNYLLYSYSTFSATNINQPNKLLNIGNKSPAPMLIKYNGGIEVKFNKLYTTLNLLFLYLRGNQLLFGAWYRLRDSFIFMGGIKFPSMAIRASYDLNTNLFGQERSVNVAQPAFEISLQFHISENTGYRKTSNPFF